MNLLNAQSHVEYRFTPWLLAAGLVLCALLLASQPIEIGHQLVVNQPRTSSAGLNSPAMPHIQPVPVPPARQATQTPPVHEMPAPATASPEVIPQRVATPPSGK